MILTTLSIFPPVSLDRETECGHLLERLETSGTKIMTSGPIVRQLRKCRQRNNKQYSR